MTSFNYEDFSKQLKEIIKLSDSILDNWIIQEKKEIETGLFATKKLRKIWKQKDGSENIVTFEYHIAYSISYEVPLLCFIVYKDNGSQISIENCWNILQLPNTTSMLTQMDHPVLQLPFLTIHPCKTAELIEKYFGESKNVLVSWLSVMGPFVGLSVPHDYVSLTVKN